jgi:hypothetical protein
MPIPKDIPASEVRPKGAKLKITISKKGEVEICGNRLGLQALSNICAALSKSVGEPENHYHFMDNEGFWGTDPGSISLVIYGQDW